MFIFVILLISSCNKDRISADNLEGEWTLINTEYMLAGKKVYVSNDKETWLFQQGNLKIGVMMPRSYMVVDNCIYCGVMSFTIKKLTKSSLILSETWPYESCYDDKGCHPIDEVDGLIICDSYDGVHYHCDNGSIVCVSSYIEGSTTKCWHDSIIYHLTR